MDLNKLVFENQNEIQQGQNMLNQQSNNSFGNQQIVHSFGNPEQHFSQQNEMNQQNMQQQQQQQQTALGNNNTMNGDDLKLDYLKEELNGLNQHILNYGFQQLGNLFSGNAEDIEQTLKAVYSMLQQRQLDIEQRKSMFEKCQKLEQDKMNYHQNLQRAVQKYQQLEMDKEKNMNKVQVLDKQYKSEITKLQIELKEVTNNFSKIQNREAQFQNDLRRKDITIKNYQEQVKKLQDKKNVFQNGVEFQSNLEKTNLTISEIANGNNEFSNIMGQGYEQIHSQLLEENEMLKDGLTNIHKELNDMLKIRKDLYCRRKRLQYGEEEYENSLSQLEEMNMIPFKKEIFQMPGDFIGDDGVKLLEENVRRFRTFMDKIDEMQDQMEQEQFGPEDEEEIEKIKCLKNVKNLLKNYKYVIETQDDLLQKTIIKTNDFQIPNDIEMGIGRFNKIMDDKEIEKARQFILEQKTFLEQKNKDLEHTRVQMNETVSRLNEEKNQVLQRRRELENEAKQFKDNVIDMLEQNVLQQPDIDGNNNGDQNLESFRELGSHNNLNLNTNTNNNNNNMGMQQENEYNQNQQNSQLQQAMLSNRSNTMNNNNIGSGGKMQIEQFQGQVQGQGIPGQNPMVQEFNFSNQQQQ